jgi:hypothetical protein
VSTVGLESSPLVEELADAIRRNVTVDFNVRAQAQAFFLILFAIERLRNFIQSCRI